MEDTSKRSSLQQAWDAAPELAKRWGDAEDASKAELASLRKDAERYRKLVACGKYAAASIGGGWGLAHSGVHTGRSSKAELDAAADALPAVGDA